MTPGSWIALPQRLIFPRIDQRKGERSIVPQRMMGCVRSHLVLFFEAVALGTLHLRDVLQHVGHTDGGMKLRRLVRHVHGLALAQRVRVRRVSVCVRLHQAAGVAGQGLSLVCNTRQKTQAEELVCGNTRSRFLWRRTNRTTRLLQTCTWTFKAFLNGSQCSFQSVFSYSSS